MAEDAEVADVEVEVEDAVVSVAAVAAAEA
jgi:hypothetical protein